MGIVREGIVRVKTALTRSRIGGVEYVVNPYRGCAHGCAYCYAPLMGRGDGTLAEPWGSYVLVKENLVEVLAGELSRRRKPPGSVMLSSVCDPYQPAEKRHELTRRCVESLAAYGWEIGILTRSPLVLRDLELLRDAGATVGMSIPTENDRVRRRIEPNAPSIESRIGALARLHEAGISTWVFVAPLLPMNPERYHELIAPHVDSYMISALNHYDLAADPMRAAGLGVVLTKSFASKVRARLTELFDAHPAAGTRGSDPLLPPSPALGRLSP